MKYSKIDQIPEINKHYNKAIKEFNHYDKKMNIIWYGDDYKDLPTTIEHIVKKIKMMRKQPLKFDELRKEMLGG